MLRYRGLSKKTIETVKALDAFPKVPESYVETSASGAAISIFTSILIGFLVISEIGYFFDTRFEYEYKVDIEYDTKVWLNFDITIATPCQLIGADVVDVTDQVLVHNGKIFEEPTLFSTQSQTIDRTPLFNNDDGLKINELALKQSYTSIKKQFAPSKKLAKNVKADACRFYGNIPLTKVAGNFHVVSGKPVDMFGGHAHLSFLLSNAKYNFSHRIDHFSFGDMRSGLINALDGSKKTSGETNYVFQYYLNVVSTKVRTSWIWSDTFQFSVSELSREIDHSSGSHGMPGIFFKYDFAPVCVTIKEHSIPFGRFLVRLCGIVGGIFATSCIINGLINTFKIIFSDLANIIKGNKNDTNVLPKNNGLKVESQNIPLLTSKISLKT